jgi:hypothetical protein
VEFFRAVDRCGFQDLFLRPVSVGDDVTGYVRGTPAIARRRRIPAIRRPGLDHSIEAIQRQDEPFEIHPVSLTDPHANDAQYSYQGTPLELPSGTYLIAAEVPTYSGQTMTSATLVFARETVRRSETIRLNGSAGRRLSVTLAGASAAVDQLSANVCMSIYSGGQETVVGGAWAGPGVPVYAVPVKSGNITFEYSDILTSATGATYYLIGSARGEIPRHLAYTQRASHLARLTMALRSGAYGSSEFDWSIQSGTSQSFCGVGQETNTYSVQSWVNYLTPGPWTTSVTAYSQDSEGNFDRNAYFFSDGTYKAGVSYTDAYGSAVVGPGASFPTTSRPDQAGQTGTLISYGPYLFTSPLMHGAQICCDRSTVSLRLGGRVIKTERVGTGGVFDADIHRSGWYTMNVDDHRYFQGGGTPANLLSPQVAVSFRFRAFAHPAGDGDYQNLPLTDARYDARGLNSDNQATAGGTTTLNVTIARPANAGIATPVYRLKAVKFYASFNDGSTWLALKASQHAGTWLLSVPDPASGYVTIRSIITDVHGDSTEQTVYRAYGIAG